jgi:hypothetical protein
MTRRKVIIELTDEQRNEIREELGRELTHVTIQLVGGCQLIVDAFEAADAVDEKL